MKLRWIVLALAAANLWAQGDVPPTIRRKPAPDQKVEDQKTEDDKKAEDKKPDDKKAPPAKDADTPDYPRTVRPIPTRQDDSDAAAPKLKHGGPARPGDTSSTSQRDVKPDPNAREQDLPSRSTNQRNVKPDPKAKEEDVPSLSSPSYSRSGERASPKPALEVESAADGRVTSRNRTLKLATRTDELIDEATESALAFTENLPNFICTQVTWRHQSETRTPNWQAHDRVEADLVYFDGKEEYRNTKINGKPLKKGSPQDTGTWSMGEFGTWLIDIYNPASAAEFRFRHSSDAAGMRSMVYDFSVKQTNSHWRVQVNKVVYPAFTGSVWIDPITKRTLRIEAQARNMPRDLNWDHLEVAIDYGWVTIGGQRYLLPLHSENVACMTGSFVCTKNEIDFKNYRKFTAESQLSTVETDVSYPQSDSKVSYPGSKPDETKKDPPPKKQQ